MIGRAPHSGWLVAAVLAMLPAPLLAQAPAPPPPERIRVLLVQRAPIGESHLRYPVAGDGETRPANLAGTQTPGRNPNAGEHQKALSDAFWKSVADYDRNAEWFRALQQVFAQRAPLFEITSSADVPRYFRGAMSPTLTGAAAAEQFAFVITLGDSFVGLTAIDAPDTLDGLVTPYSSMSYTVYEVAGNTRLARGDVSAAGFMSQPLSKATADGTLFTRQWPFMCAVNADELVDQLLRKDRLHDMARRVGRGADVPAVAARITQLQSQLDWRLAPAPGWRELRLTPSSRALEPRDANLNRARIVFEVDYLLPELAQGVSSIADYLPIWVRRELLRAPLTEVRGPFTEISAPGYEAFRFLGPAKEHVLVFFHTPAGVLMRVVRVSIAGDFDTRYPALRPAIEQMLARSDVVLNASARP